MEPPRPYRNRVTASPALNLLFPYCLGILLAHHTSITVVQAVIFTLISTILWVWREYSTRSAAIARIPSSYALLAISVLSGLFSHVLTLERDQERVRVESLLAQAGIQEIHINGVPLECRGVDPVQVTLQVDRTVIGQLEAKARYRILLYVRGSPESFGPCSGVRGRYHVRLLPGSNLTNPGAFDRRDWMRRRGVAAVAEWVSTESLTEHSDSFSRRLQRAFTERIESRYPGQERGLALALMAGDRQAIDTETRKLMSRAGIAHITAVSGLHVGLLLSPIWLLLRIMRKRAALVNLMLVVLASVLFTYCAALDFRPSVSRASLMGWFWMVSAAGGRGGNGLNLLAVSALILLIFDTSQLFDVGFQLSYTAVLIIITMIPVIRERFPFTLKQGIRARVVMLVTVSTTVQAGIAPLLIWYFGEISLIAPLANLAVLPVISLLLPWMFIMVLIGGVPEQLLIHLNRPNEWGINWILMVARIAGEFEWGWIKVSGRSAWMIITWALSALWFRNLKNRSGRPTLSILLAAVLIIGCMIELRHRVNAYHLKVTILDVGQGDAIHIRTPGGRHILVDTGRWTPYGDSGSSVILPYLESEGVKRLDALVLTHPHSDHIGGAKSIIEAMKIDSVYFCGGEYRSQIARRTLDAIHKESIPMRAVTKGDRLHTDPSVRLFVVGPGSVADGVNPNNRSVVLKLVYGETSILMAGDAERNQEERMVGVYDTFLNSDLLKAAHHGSRTSSGTEFLVRVGPAITVVSSGLHNRFGHPHREAVERFGIYGGRVYYTALDGALRFRSDGRVISREP